MIFAVVGARPNFIKMAPVIEAARRRSLPVRLIHTGQHYGPRMSQIFFQELGMPEPDVNLGIGSGSHAEQTARIMKAFEKTCLEANPALVIVAGDVNSTLACALAAAKLNVPVAHVEAGLRSFDRRMPEEINRILTDRLAELLFTTEPSAEANLRREGIPAERTHFTGNTMIDSLKVHLPRALQRRPWEAFGVAPQSYGVVTFHRPRNVDDPSAAAVLAEALGRIGGRLPLIFPMHPRTGARSDGMWRSLPGVRIVEPLGYLDFLGLMARAQVVITDSGGIQEETTALGVPCVTVRESTERPVTLTQGTNRLVKASPEDIWAAVFEPRERAGTVPEKWDGRAAGRIIEVIETWLARSRA